MMSRYKKLHQVKTVSEFEGGYWYVVELKDFAKEIGVRNSAKLRKDQLEKIIKQYIETGRVLNENKLVATKRYKMDKLNLNENIQYYVSNKKTKSFILSEALKLCPQLPKKSGVWYWTNRWREERLQKNIKTTYRELIQHFVSLSNHEGRLPQIPSARFNNFITDFLAAKEGSREQATAAWEELKSLNVSKTYDAWKRHHE